ncbi:MAG: hypothetical protein Q8P51_08920 [Ignavibacteria bacterium]|nr:hypothetical protein [Ignavibacteria bacterium]
MKTGDSIGHISWIGTGSTSIVPPADYWTFLASEMGGPQLAGLKDLSDQRLNEFTRNSLPPPEEDAVALLERVTADGWLEKRGRQRCPFCEYELSAEEVLEVECPECHEVFTLHGGVKAETIYVRELAPIRDVEWVIAIHGMKSTGAWQEAFSWYLSTTWGKSVPVAIYKYGIVLAGVILAWRRCKLRDDLRNKLGTLQSEAVAQGFVGKPDVLAHSFGTWLLGHLLENEMKKKPEERLRFGRVVLIGCILRPDFDWKGIKDAGLVDDVLNFYGSKDAVVPLAHVTISDSGPSGRRGFDGDEVFNVQAEGYGHSVMFSIEEFLMNGRCGYKVGKMSHLEYCYKRYWRPFLTLPRSELNGLPDRVKPPTAWRQMPWLFRGTAFPYLAVPFLSGLIALIGAAIGRTLWGAWEILAIVTSFSGAGLLGLLIVIEIVKHAGGRKD